MPYVQTRYVIALGFFTLGVALFYSTNLVPQIDFYTLAKMRAFQTLGLAFLFVPISTIVYSTLPKNLNNDAAALFTMFRNLAGSIGIAAATALITTRTQVRMSYLGGHLNPFNQNYVDMIDRNAQTMLSYGFNPDGAHQRAINMAYTTLHSQSSLLAYKDVFAICGILAFCVVPLTLLFSPSKSGGARGGH
jgi:DHA2 family multidrug resistance protein